MKASSKKSTRKNASTKRTKKPGQNKKAASSQQKKKNAAAKNNQTNTSLCSVSKQCGACQYIDVPYKKQLQTKQRIIEDLFSDIADEATVFNSILGMDEPFYYRNKVVSPYAPGKKIKGQKQTRNRHVSLDRDILCGMYAQGSHRIIENQSCLLENKQAKQIILAIKKLMMKYGIEPYREDTGTGFMRHAIVRVGHSSGEILVTLVTNSRQFPGAKHFVRDLVKQCPSITSVVQNINKRQTNVILGEREQRLYGPGFILDTLCGLSFRISSHSFYQVNSTQTELLYKRAIEMAELTGSETILDAYCGTGTIGLVAAKGIEGANHASRVIGVDNVASAITDAKNNAKHNGIENADFICDDAGSYLLELAQDLNSEENALDVLLMDPPRAGASESFLRATCALSPRRIVYISCNPKTQQRDTFFLVKHGYRIKSIQPVDMFPHTSHIETVAVLTREKSVKSYAYVNISPSELGMGDKVKKPTYKQIQEYVLKNHGLKVSSLYIANLKDELGLDKQFSYEEAEMSAEKRPKCPPEKREAILDAFRHFGLIGEGETEK